MAGDGLGGSDDAVEAAGIASIEEAAAGWVARLSSSDATDADRAAFAAWRDTDPAHARAHAEMDALWRSLGRLPDPRPRRKSRHGSRATLAGLAAVALLAVGTLAGPYGLDRLRADLWSGIGDIRHAVLADGTRVDLNTDTAIRLRFGPDERGVELLRGEAGFDVAADPNRPFVVRGGGLDVRAVGTRFYVRADGTDMPVGVAEGRVAVEGGGRHALVSAGEAVRVGADASLTVTAANVERRMAWRDGRLIFSGQPLSTVLAELGRYRLGRIVLVDRTLGERRVTGAFDPIASDATLDAIATTMGARLTRITPLLVLVGTPL